MEKCYFERWETTKNIDIDNKDFIFTYNDIESDGVRKWVEISEKYPRALNPILSTIRWDSRTVENELFNLCSGVEALRRYIYQESPDKSLGGGKMVKFIYTMRCKILLIRFQRVFYPM